MQRIKKKTHLGPNYASRVIWAHFGRCSGGGDGGDGGDDGSGGGDNGSGGRGGGGKRW